MNRIHDPNYLKLYFPLNGPAADYSGNNWPVTGDTITDFIDGPFGRQIPVFNGTNGQVEFAEGMEHPFNWDGFTISFWIKRSNLFDGNAKGVYSYATTVGDNQTGLEIRVANDGRVIFASYPDNSQGANLGVSNIPEDHILNIVLCFGASDRSTEWWINGNLVQTSTKAVPIVAGGDNHRLGVRSALSSWFTGNLWNFRLYNTILTPEEIKQLHFHEQTNKKAVSAPQLPLMTYPDVSDPDLQFSVANTQDFTRDISGKGNDASPGNLNEFHNLPTGGANRFVNISTNSGGLLWSPDLVKNNETHSLSLWYKFQLSLTGTNNRLWIHGAAGDYQIFINTTTNTRWTMGGFVLDAPAHNSDSWNHLTVSFDRSSHTRKIYINGELKNESQIPSDFNYDSILSNSSRLAFAGFGGEIKDVRQYSRVLQPAEVKRIWLEGNPEPDLILHTNDGLKDLAIINHTLTPTGSPIELGNGFKSGFSLSPDTSSYVEAVNKGYWTDMDLTFSFWMKVFDVGNGNIVAPARHVTQGGGFGLYCNRSDRTFLIAWRNSDSNNITTEFSNPRLFSWCHYVVRAKRNGINRVYINGDLVGSPDYTANGSPTNNSSFRIGNYNTTATLAGSYHIKDFRAYTGEKSAQWVKDYYLKTKDAY